MISLIIPVYNGEKYIKSCIENLDKQTYKNFEAIFIDDGSTDNTYKIIKSYEGKTRFKLILHTQKNGGVSVARNKGIELATQDFISFMDSDDLLVCNYLEMMIKTLTNNKVDMVLCKHTINNEITEEKKVLDTNVKITVRDTLQCLNDYLYGKINPGIWCILVKKDIIIGNKLRFKEGLKYSEDLEFIWRMINFCHKIAYINAELYIYILQPNSATSVFDHRRLDGVKAIKDLEGFFKDENIEFYPNFKKYAVAKMMWSVTWQAATYYSQNEFDKFIRDNNVKKEIKKLICYKNLKVRLSSILFLVSKKSFVFVANRIGKRYIH